MYLEEKLTIFIPSKDRVEFIKRILIYYSESRFKGKILIGDSSNEINKKLNLNNISKFNNKINIEYFHMPNISAGHACSELSKKIKTEYAAFLSDDDILVTSNIEKSINFLEKNKDYSGINGEALLIGTEKGNAFGKIVWISKYYLCKLMEEDPYDRIISILKNPLNLNFSICRSIYHKEIYNLVDKLSRVNSSFQFEEIIFAVVMSSKGKIYQPNYLSNIRQGHDNQLYHSIDVYDWITDENWRDANEIIMDLITENLINYKKISKKEASTIFKKIILKKYIEVLNSGLNNINRNNIIKKKNFNYLILFKELLSLSKGVFNKINIFKSNASIFHAVKGNADHIKEINFLIDVLKNNNR